MPVKSAIQQPSSCAVENKVGGQAKCVPVGKAPAVRAWLHFGCNKLIEKAEELSGKYFDFK
jgi:hypothetical protein